MRWAADGVPVCRRGEDQVTPAITGDGRGGTLVTWFEVTGIGMQRLTSTGTVAEGWPPDGILLVNDTLQFISVDQPSIIADGDGGGYALWSDVPTAAWPNGPWTARLQHISANGVVAPGWPEDGLLLSTGGHQNIPIGIVSDGQGGVIAAWTEEEVGLWPMKRLWVQRVRPDGTSAPGWPSNGIMVEEGTLGYESMVKDHAGGATLSWYPSPSAPDVSSRPTVRRVTRDGVVNPYWGGYPDVDGQPVASPTPSAGPVTVSFALATLSSVEAKVFDLSGRRVRDLGRIAESPAGQRSLVWDGRDDEGAALPAGLYFVRMRWGQRDHLARVVIAR
ncbi:MAG: FlgD immunoglobulin-like domain containing protein [Candidatus Eisenbacteria bacterium]